MISIIPSFKFIQMEIKIECSWISLNDERNKAYCQYLEIREYCQKDHLRFPTITVRSQPTSVPSEFPSQCENDLSWNVIRNGTVVTCQGIASSASALCGFFNTFISNGKTTKESCCICGGSKLFGIAVFRTERNTNGTTSNLAF